MRKENWNNAGGYGFWCGKKCAEAKKEQGIAPLGSKRTSKSTSAQSDVILSQAALESSRDTSWSSGATIAVIGASLIGIAIMVVIIKKATKK